MSARRAPRRGEQGQATVELALLLPFVAVLLLAIIQVSLLAHRQVLVIHATREAARAAAVVDDDSRARLAASIGFARGADLDPGRVEIHTELLASTVRVTATHRARSEVPIIRWFLGDVELQATATMARERSLVESAVP